MSIKFRSLVITIINLIINICLQTLFLLYEYTDNSDLLNDKPYPRAIDKEEEQSNFISVNTVCVFSLHYKYLL